MAFAFQVKEKPVCGCSRTTQSSHGLFESSRRRRCRRSDREKILSGGGVKYGLLEEEEPPPIVLFCGVPKMSVSADSFSMFSTCGIGSVAFSFTQGHKRSNHPRVLHGRRGMGRGTQGQQWISFLWRGVIRCRLITGHACYIRHSVDRFYCCKLPSLLA